MISFNLIYLFADVKLKIIVMADNILSVVTSLADGALSHSQLTHHTKALTKVNIVNMLI